jgi:hypothetical protein
VLRGIEQRLESIFEGLFGRAFRSHVQPVEIARKLAKEMDDHRTSSVSRTYAPNEYLLYLSPGDRQQFRDYEHALLQELSVYLAEHARKQGYALLTMPRVVVEEDDDLGLGQFGIATRMVQPARQPEPQPPPRVTEPAPARDAGPAPVGDPSLTRVFATEPEPVAPAAPRNARLELQGVSHELDRPVTVLGRGRGCEIVLDDPGVSRRHCEIRRDGDAYVIVDVGSTNGVIVNGRRVSRTPLEHGDRITLGQTELQFVDAG